MSVVLKRLRNWRSSDQIAGPLRQRGLAAELHNIECSFRADSLQALHPEHDARGHRRERAKPPPDSSSLRYEFTPTLSSSRNFIRLIEFDFAKLNLILVEKIELDCHVRSSGPADPRPSQDGSPFKLCSPLDVVGFRGLSTCGCEYELHFSEIS